MSLLSLLDQRVTVQRIDDGTADELNTPTETVTGTDEYMGRLVPVDARELLVGRDTVIVDLSLWLEPGAVIAARDRAVIDGDTYEVMAAATVYRAPSLAHHIEVPVRRIVSG